MGCSQSKTNDVINSNVKPAIAPPVSTVPKQHLSDQSQSNVKVALTVSTSEANVPQLTTPTNAKQILVNVPVKDAPLPITENKLVKPDDETNLNSNDLSHQSGELSDHEMQPIISKSQSNLSSTPVKSATFESAFISISPHVGFVIKTKHLHSGEKVFINVLYHEAVAAPVSCDAQTSTDKKGEQCLAYSVVIPARLYQASYAYDSPEINKVSTEAIQLVNAAYSVQLDMDYKIPKMKRGYVGDKVDDLRIAAPLAPQEEMKSAPQVALENCSVERVAPVMKQITPIAEAENSPTPPIYIAPVIANQTLVVDKAVVEISSPLPPLPPPVATPPEPVISSSDSSSGSDDNGDNSHPRPVASQSVAVSPSIVDVDLSPESDDSPSPAIIQIATRPVPPKMHGWLKKQGHMVKNWKSRYFVLDNGYLTYYVDKLDAPPFGRDMKGQLCLAGYRETEVVEGSVPAGNGKRGSSANLDVSLWANRIYLVYNATLFTPEEDAAPGDDEFQALLLEASSSDEKHAWLAAIQAHTEYFESTLVAAASPLLNSAASSNSLNGGEADSLSVSEQYAPMKRTSTAGGMGSRTVSRSPSRQSTYSVMDDKKRWAIFLHAGEELVMTGLAGKPNPVGIHLIRQLILTSHKRLMYIDAKTMELKGEIEWSSDPAAVYPQAKKIDETTFDVVQSAKRTYRFICKDSCTAGMWVTAISNTAPPPSAHNKWQS